MSDKKEVTGPNKGGAEKPARMMSIDALRGFDMFFILYGAAIIVAVAKMCGADNSFWLIQQMTHVPWEGLHQHDTIFPLFLFLAGVTWPFSLAGQLAKGRSAWQIHLKVVWRATALVLLGMLLNGLLVSPSEHFRLGSVLGVIGSSWGAAAILFMHVKRPRLRLALPFILLFGVWAAMALAGGHYAPDQNAFVSLRRTLTAAVSPGFAEIVCAFDILPTGAAQAFLGMLAGTLLRREDLSGKAKTLWLLRAAAVLFVLTLVFVYVLRMPIIKNMWTSSFVLATSTYSAVLLALFYWIIDVKGWRRWTFFFRVIGANSILAYLIMMTSAGSPIKHYLFCRLGNAVPVWLAPTVGQIGYLASAWIILYFLYRNKAFLRV